MPTVETMKGKVKEVYNQGYGFVTKHPYKTAATFAAIALVTSLTAAYFLSPAYATFVGTVGTKAATLVSPAITAISAFAVAHPLVASLVVLAAVAALITVPVLAYKNSNKASQIDAVKEVFNKCEKDGGTLAMEGNSIKLQENNAPGLLTEIATVLGLVQQQAK